MANPTSNFNWQMPTPTDLVTDLPADFEVFGQAVDSSMADLLGGTTGQVLAKNSNTNMDFVWVTQDDTNAIQNAIVDAKGDLIAASAADTPARLAVGANGETLVADSSTATGLDWKSAAEQYPWQTWTPTYNNFTIGNATVTARYQQIGKTVNVFYSAIWGSTTAFTSYPQIFLPVAAVRTGYTTGNGYLQDTGVGSWTSSILIETTTYFQFAVLNTGGTYGTNTFMSANTVPFTWTNTDQMFATFSYEAA